MGNIILHHKQFVPYLSEGALQARIAELGAELNRDYEDKDPLFVGVLNGAFRFAADLMRHIDVQCEINFVKLTSYRGTESTGRVSSHIGLNADLTGRHIVVLEDIIDTGHTIEYLHELLSAGNPASIRVATLLYKPEAYLGKVPVHYCGFEIPNLFVVGYGLDYDGLGRNLNNIYQIKASC
jgi:hypoxanthine phosphoribosyltransferase